MQQVPWVLVAADINQRGGMEKANHALARYLLERGTPVHLVAHQVADDVGNHPLAHVYPARKPLDSYFLGRPFLARLGEQVYRQVIGSAPGARAVVNGANCPLADINWSHYVHAAWAPPMQYAPVWFRAKINLERAIELGNERRAYQRARLIISNSERTRLDLERLLGPGSHGKIQTIYLGCESNLHPPAPAEREAARRRFGLAPERPAAVFVGAIGYDERKGLDVLLGAWKELTADPAWDTDLLIAGGGAALETWKRQAAQMGLSSHVRFLGYSKEVPSLLAAADVLVSPVRYEPYGLNLQEALCAGLPVITSNEAGIAERFPDDLAKLQIPAPPEISSLVGKLRLWRRDPEHWREVAIQFGSFLRQQTWRQTAVEIVDAVERAVSPSTGSPVMVGG